MEDFLERFIPGKKLKIVDEKDREREVPAQMDITG